MTAEVARELIAAGFFMMLVLLRLEAERFGTAEYDKAIGRPTVALSWLAWYAIGLAFLAAVYVVHPEPHDQLYLLIGHLADAIVYGVPLAALGAVIAVGYALYRYGYLRLPPAGAYPRAAINSIGTAVVDEATFRGIALGSLVTMGLPNGYAIGITAIGYVLVTRLAAPARRRFMLVPAFGYGLLGGWATLATGGIGAAIAFHAATSFALFVCTGHAGQAAALGREPEEVEAATQLPEGWRVAGRPTEWGRVMAPRRALLRTEPRGEEKERAARSVGGSRVSVRAVAVQIASVRSAADRIAVRASVRAAGAWSRLRAGVDRTMHRPQHP